MALNVIIVDDSAVMRTMLARALRASRLPLGEIHEAGEGRDALACLARHRIDLALIDLHMPGMSGAELLRHIRADARMADMPVLVISAEDRQAQLAELFAQGAAFLQKPFSVEALRSVVGQICACGGNAASA